jgi:hypothetical protein
MIYIPWQTKNKKNKGSLPAFLLLFRIPQPGQFDLHGIKIQLAGTLKKGVVHQNQLKPSSNDKSV